MNCPLCQREAVVCPDCETPCCLPCGIACLCEHGRTSTKVADDPSDKCSGCGHERRHHFEECVYSLVDVWGDENDEHCLCGCEEFREEEQ